MSDTSEVAAADAVEEGKNKFALLCTRCPSKILCPLNGDYLKEERVRKRGARKFAPSHLRLLTFDTVIH